MSSSPFPNTSSKVCTNSLNTRSLHAILMSSTWSVPTKSTFQFFLILRCLSFYDIDTPVTLAKLERGDFELGRKWINALMFVCMLVYSSTKVSDDGKQLIKDARFKSDELIFRNLKISKNQIQSFEKIKKSRIPLLDIWERSNLPSKNNVFFELWIFEILVFEMNWNSFVKFQKFRESNFSFFQFFQKFKTALKHFQKFAKKAAAWRQSHPKQAKNLKKLQFLFFIFWPVWRRPGGGNQKSEKKKKSKNIFSDFCQKSEQLQKSVFF